MHRRPAGIALGLLLVASFALAGCVSTGGGSGGTGGSVTPPSDGDSGGPAGSPGSIPHPTGADQLVVRVQTVGGFVAPSFLLSRYPLVSVYGDGSVITEGPQIAIFPGPLLPNLLVRHVAESSVQQLLAAIRDEGLFEKSGSFDAVGIADATTTELTFVTDVPHTISAYALGEVSEDTGLDQATTATRSALRRLIGRLDALTGAVAGADQPYHASAIRLFVTPGTPGDGQGGPAQQPRAWPLPTALGSFGEPFPVLAPGGRCGVVSGADLVEIAPALAQANILTPWLSGGRTYGLVAHPLLPGETGCPAAG